MRPKVYFSDAVMLRKTENMTYRQALQAVLTDYFLKKAQPVCRKAKLDLAVLYGKDSEDVEFHAGVLAESIEDYGTMQELNDEITAMVEDDISDMEEKGMTENTENTENNTENEEQELSCPCCGKPMKSGEKNWYCECGFSCGHFIAGAEMTRERLGKIFEGKSDIIEFIGKTGKPFSAKMKVSKEKKTLVFDFPEPKDTRLKCPKCGKKIIDWGRNYGCEGKDFRCYKQMCGVDVTLEELGKILEGKGGEHEFTGKSGKAFTARLKLSEAKDKVEYEFIDDRKKSSGLGGSELEKLVRDDEKEEE